MKQFIICAAFFCMVKAGISQDNIIPTTDSIVIKNDTSTVVINFSSLTRLPSKVLGDVSTINHRGEIRSVRKNVKGVLLRDAMQKVVINVLKPKELFGYSFILEGSDGYKSVLSYNEIFSTEAVYIIVESDGKKINEVEDRMAILTLAQAGKARVFMKGLKKITLQKVL